MYKHSYSLQNQFFFEHLRYLKKCYLNLYLGNLLNIMWRLVILFQLETPLLRFRLVVKPDLFAMKLPVEYNLATEHLKRQGNTGSGSSGLL